MHVHMGMHVCCDMIRTHAIHTVAHARVQSAGIEQELIGGPGLGGVSQEIRKKVTIAVELIMEPQLLFLDEPTTGLGKSHFYS